MYNFREEKKIGRITAYYKTSLRGDECCGSGDKRRSSSNRDDMPIEWIAAGIFICLAGMIISRDYWEKKAGGRSER